MKNVVLGNMKGIGVRVVGWVVVILTLMSLMACFAAIPPLVHYYKTKDAYVGTVALDMKAEQAYSEIHNLAEEHVREGKIKITNDARQILFLEITDGVQNAGIKVNTLTDRQCNMVITADIPASKAESKELEKEREKELAARIMRTICQELNQNCQLVEQ